MNKRMKKAVQESFRFPETKHKNEFLMQAEVISAQEMQRKKRYPVIFRLSAAAAAGAMALGVWANLSDRSKPSENDFRDEPAIVTTTVGNGEIQPINTAIGNGETASATTVNVSAVTTVRNGAAKTTAVTTGTALTALGAKSRSTTASRSDHSRVTTKTKSETFTTEYTITNEEKTYYMKHLGAFASAFVMGGNAIPMASAAEYKLPYTRMYPDESDIFAELEANIDIADINCDGVFNIRDCYDVFCYSNYYQVSDTAAEKCRAYGISKVNDEENNAPSWLNYTELIRYLLIKEGAKPEFFSLESYPYRDTITGAYAPFASELFVSAVFSESDHLMAGYPLISAAYRNKRIDLDVNADGLFDINDYIDYFVCTTNLSKSKQDSGDFIPWERPETTVQRCNELRSKAEAITRDSWLENYFVWCLLEYTPFRSEYAEASYYNSIIPEKYSRYYSPERYFEEYCETTGIEEYLFTFNTQKFNSCFDEYCKDVAAGRRSAPDINLDGVIDRSDYEASDVYFGDILNGRNASQSALPPRIWNNITSNCDFNNNGTSGDVYDIMITQMYVLIKTGESNSSSGGSYNYDSNMGMLWDIDSSRSGDVNGDGEVDMADAVLIMQYLANPDKYQLTDAAMFNADVEGDCDGLNSNDASAIQRRLLDL